MQKFLTLLGSRKFWASIVSLLAIFQFVPETQEGQIVSAILTVVTSVAYVIGTAIEANK